MRRASNQRLRKQKPRQCISAGRWWTAGKIALSLPCPDWGRRRAAQLVALCEIAAERCRIADVARWLETPLHREAPISCLDLVVAGRLDLVLSLAQDQVGGPELVLDEFDPDWRSRYCSDVQVFTAADGMPGLRLVGTGN